ncbi:MAG: CoA pyrophosphatase [Sphingomonadales bacterium]
MNKDIQKILKVLEDKFSAGLTLDGPSLSARTLPSDMFIAGFEEDREAGRQAAVLIPLLARETGLSVFFTKRPEGMKEHPGQVSFPGGRHEGVDKSLIETALREAHEEVGLAPKLVRVVGQLAPYRTITKYEVTPVIGLVDPSFKPILDSREVDEVFEAPLAFFLEVANLKTRERLYQGKQRPYYYFDYKEFHIWGATAAMMVNFREAVFAFARD